MVAEMSLGDPKWEVIDPTPNVHALFIHFDKTFFWTKLTSRAVQVRWSKRMYSCAGICSYEGRGGLCDIALSEPLLKLRPRKDLIETLLHEMIHAYLFISGGDRDRDGHGPKFQSHMHRINKAAGINISIYHDFHDEVKLYQTHWWRCNGPCQYKKPRFGIVRRTANRQPGPTDRWWEWHRRNCGGTFIKIKEPEKKVNKISTKKPMGDITKFLNNTTITEPPNGVGKAISPNNAKTGSNIKTISNITKKTQGVRTKGNSGNTVVVTQKTINTKSDNSFNVCNNIIQTGINTASWEGKGHRINGGHKINADDNNVAETVRNIWANKQLNSNKAVGANNKINNKRSSLNNIDGSPPFKMKKIDDYFNTNTSPKKHISNESATSVLKDIYGEDFKLYQKSETGSKIIALQNPNADLVNCPICNEKIKNAQINMHLDECLNKDVIDKLSNNIIRESVNIKSDIEVNNDITTKVIADNKNLIRKEEKPVTNYDLERPSTSKEILIKKEPPDYAVTDLSNPENVEHKCPCCTEIINVTMDEHLEDCLSFMEDNTTVPDEGSFVKTEVISLIDDEDDADDSMIFNATGTMYPCPCCLIMIEENVMNSHLDECLKK